MYSCQWRSLQERLLASRNLSHVPLLLTCLNITAAMRLIGSFVYIIEPLRAPRAALGQPKSSQELQDQPMASQEPPRGKFSKCDRKTIQTAADIPKKLKKNIAREHSPALKCDACQSNQAFWNSLLQSSRIPRKWSQNCGSDPPFHAHRWSG